VHRGFVVARTRSCALVVDAAPHTTQVLGLREGATAEDIVNAKNAALKSADAQKARAAACRAAPAPCFS
jgi:hypothetical protein